MHVLGINDTSEDIRGDDKEYILKKIKVSNVWKSEQAKKVNTINNKYNTPQSGPLLVG